MKGDMPCKVIRCGSVKAKIWKNTVTKNDEQIAVFSIQVDRTYRDKNGDWQRTSKFNLADLPKVQLVAAKAFEHLSLTDEQEENGDQ